MNLVNWLLAGVISLAMMYTGLLFDPAWANVDFVRSKLRPFAGLAFMNYLVVPLLAIAMVNVLPVNPALALALLTLAALPCAPLVPVLVTLAAEPPEWPLFVFLGFSILSLLVVLVMIAIMANSAAYASHIGADTAGKILQYVLTVYAPMLLGALARLWAPGMVQRLIAPVRKLTSFSMVAILVLFAIAHRADFANVSGYDLLLILGFIVCCVLVGTMTGKAFSGPRLTSILSTTFRNIALAIAFTTVVLRRPDITAYLIVYSSITVIACAALLMVHRSVGRRPASG